MRIVRLANFVTPQSGGLRTALRSLGAGYLEAGHEPILLTPGPVPEDIMAAEGRIIRLPGPRLPGFGGYRVLIDRSAVARTLATLRPDRIEVSDRTTLRWTGEWARRAGVPAVMVSHESVEGLLGVATVPAEMRRALAARLNRATAAHYDRIICTTEWAAREFDRAGATNIAQVPLGVDLDRFRPDRYSDVIRARYARPDEVLLISCTRLSAEKRPRRALRTVARLVAEGLRVRLVMIGDGPLRSKLTAESAGLPVTFTGWIEDRSEVAALLATADVVLAPGPIETFGLSALEALASGTPVVVSASSALPGVVGDAGIAVDGDDFSSGVRALLSRSETARRRCARARAETFSWASSVRGFLDVHEALTATQPHPA